MSHVLMRGRGGRVCLPDPATTMIDRADGGQLVLYPPRRVWDRTALTREELTAKFDECAQWGGVSPAKAAQAIELVWALERQANVRALMDCVVR